MTRRHGIATDVSSSYERGRKISSHGPPQWRVQVFFLLAFFLATVLFLVRCAILLQSLEISTLSDYMVAQRSATSTELDFWDKDPERAPFLAILRQAGYDLKEPSLWNNKTMASMPKWSEVVKSFGSKPKIYGLDTCQQFQQTTKSFERHIGVAGMFNSGTNLLSSLLASNCQNQARIDRRGISATGMEWQVPWGKHVPAMYRGNHTTTATSKSKYRVKAPNASTVLPAVMVRNPYEWMKSMCRQSYNVQFDHSKEYCPNLVPYPSDIQAHPRFRNIKYVPVSISYGTDDHKKFKYESLAHLWNVWYEEYVHADFPRLVLRLEDLLFHAEETITQVCECGGGTMKSGGFVHVADVANLNPGIETSDNLPTGLIGSLILYGNRTHYREHYSDTQLQAAQDILQPELMKLFGYSYEK